MTAKTSTSLPSEITIDNVAETRLLWREWLHSESVQCTEVDASRVEVIDSAGVQLLVSLIRATRDDGHQIRLKAPSPVLREACDAMGISHWLEPATIAGPDDRSR